jgi:hypothetical protein
LGGRWLRLVGCGVTLLCGYVVGSIAADPGAPAAKLTLQAAFERLCADRKVSVAFREEDGKLEAPSGAPPPDAPRVAALYGRQAVKLNGVYVLVQAPPAVGSGADRLRALRESGVAAGGPERWRGFASNWRKSAASLADELGPGSKHYSSLTASQQAEVYDFMRRWRVEGQAQNLNFLLYGHNYTEP